MTETTKMELVTPGRVVVSKPVEMVVIPGIEGLLACSLAIQLYSRTCSVVSLRCMKVAK